MVLAKYIFLRLSVVVSLVSLTLTSAERLLLESEDKENKNVSYEVLLQSCTSVALSAGGDYIARGSRAGVLAYDQIGSDQSRIGHEVGEGSILATDFNQVGCLSVANEDGIFQVFNIANGYLRKEKGGTMLGVSSKGSLAHVAFLPNKNEAVIVLHNDSTSEIIRLGLDEHQPLVIHAQSFGDPISALAVDRHNPSDPYTCAVAFRNKIQLKNLDNKHNAATEKEYSDNLAATIGALAKWKQFVAYGSNTSSGIVDFGQEPPQLVYRLDQAGRAVSFSAGRLAIATQENVQLIKQNKRGTFEGLDPIPLSNVQRLFLGTSNIAVADPTSVKVWSFKPPKQKIRRYNAVSEDIVIFHTPCWKKCLQCVCKYVCCRSRYN